jgi:hypothetical protein
VRVELNPQALNKYAIALDTVRTALQNTNANRPKGFVEADDRHWQIYTNDQAREASQYRNLVIAWRDGAPVRLSDVAMVVDSVEDVRNQGLVQRRARGARHHQQAAEREHHPDDRPHHGAAAVAARLDSGRHQHRHRDRTHEHDSARRCATSRRRW